MPVADRDLQGADPREDVELGDHEPGHPVEPDGIAERDEVEPAAAAHSADDDNDSAADQYPAARSTLAGMTPDAR